MFKTCILKRRFFLFNDLGEAAEYLLQKKGVWVSGNAETFISESSVFDNDLLNFYCDGVGASYFVHKKTKVFPKKIPGCELWLELLKKCGNKKFAIIGSTDDVLTTVVHKLDSKNLVYYRNGYFSERDWLAVSDELKESKAEIVFLAMGQPLQEKFSLYLYDPKILYLPIGGSLDLFAGKVFRAPMFMRKVHLEWLYRLLIEPRRFKRYLKLFKFIPAYIKL
ncbi:WecB/TagA/CpsF family glycosyltransferase [Shewanella algae]|uniref:WecB/TagA/CpsF family glycosyltransferase n=1 Tax=Shewanella algae TaxID=38313 RepID=UPI00163EA19A|nr:WecB/TagA/CpsF family glycosyltransferase [Shewanella algae]QNH98441.1 WecB/TagA/CpsF family glycosyltransferase [Shewanella algae]